MSRQVPAPARQRRRGAFERRSGIPRGFGGIARVHCEREGPEAGEQVSDASRSRCRLTNSLDECRFAVLRRLKERADREAHASARKRHRCRLRLVNRLGTQALVDAEARETMFHRE